MMMGKDRRCLADVFPTRSSAAIFVGYIVFFIAQSVLVKASQLSDRQYPYNVTCVVMLTEFLKLLVSTLFYLKDHSWSFRSLCVDFIQHRRLLALYMCPALLYCFYNNLAFRNLQTFDPTTYNLLMQFRVVITGIVFQTVFRRRLSARQWFSLCLLTLGCLLKQLSLPAETDDHSFAVVSNGQRVSPVAITPPSNNRITGGVFTKHELDSANQRVLTSGKRLSQSGAGGFVRASSAPSVHLLHLAWNISLLLLQMLCSCVAGVYNEYLLKKGGTPGADRTADGVHIMVHNMFMYVDSIVCNTGLLAATGQAGELINLTVLEAIVGRPLVLAVVANGAVCGIIVSVFLRSLNSILKTFAGALDLALTAVVCWMVFAIPVDAPTVLSIVVVTVAAYLYSQNPVAPTGGASDRRDSETNGDGAPPRRLAAADRRHLYPIALDRAAGDDCKPLLNV